MSSRKYYRWVPWTSLSESKILKWQVQNSLMRPSILSQSLGSQCLERVQWTSSSLIPKDLKFWKFKRLGGAWWGVLMPLKKMKV